MTRYLLIFLLLVGCKTPPPDRPYAHDEVAPVTEQPREKRPAPVPYYTTNAADIERQILGERQMPFIPMGAYTHYTNAQHDALVERQIMGPPVVPGWGPFPIQPTPPAVSNWMTPKAMAVQPKAMGTNQIPGSVILTRITTTDKDGKKFTAELTLEGNSRIQATDKMAVVIFAINTPSWIIESCTNLLDGKWYPMASGTGGNTNNGALVIVDLKEDSAPIKFYRQKAQ